MSERDWAVGIACYLAAHFTLYVVFFRRRRWFGTEKGILLFHMVSALAVVVLFLVLFLQSPSINRFALLIAAGAAHSIYSLSFLEIWVLSEGGYSLRVLDELVMRGAAAPDELERKFVELSARKKAVRIDSLLNLGLMEAEGECIGLSRKGSFGARFFALVASLAGFEESN